MIALAQFLPGATGQLEHQHDGAFQIVGAATDAFDIAVGHLGFTKLAQVIDNPQGVDGKLWQRLAVKPGFGVEAVGHAGQGADTGGSRSEEHTSELQSLMRNSYAGFCLKKKTK